MLHHDNRIVSSAIALVCYGCSHRKGAADLFVWSFDAQKCKMLEAVPRAPIGSYEIALTMLSTLCFLE